MRAEERETLVNETAQLLEAGLKPSHVSKVICLKFSISRATSYRVMHEAEDVLRSSDDGPAEEDDPLNQQDVAALIASSLVEAVALQDFKAVAALTRALDSVRRWSAPALAQRRS